MKTDIPESSIAIFVMAHGAGAGMDHEFMTTITKHLNEQNIGIVRFNFPYIERGKKLPTRNKEDIQKLTDVYHQIKDEYELPIFCGGKSYGGRMTSLAAAQNMLEGTSGLIYLGFPLHGPGRDSTDRAAHLKDIEMPMLFLQGMKDKLAKPDLITKVAKEHTTSHLIFFKDADHSFKVPKKAPIDQEEVFEKLAKDISNWISKAI